MMDMRRDLDEKKKIEDMGEDNEVKKVNLFLLLLSFASVKIP